jgi:N-carbamoylputrescine amidase
MRNVTVAAVQMKCSKSVEKNIAHATGASGSSKGS